LAEQIPAVYLFTSNYIVANFMQLSKQLSPRLIHFTLFAATLISTTVAPILNGLIPAAEATPETAKSADSFVDSMVVNLHLQYYNTPYGNYSNVKQKLVALGIRHIRDGGSSDDFITKIKDLAASGIKTNYLLSPAAGVAPNSSYWVQPPGYTINDFVKNKVGSNAIDSVEILNEIDLFYYNYTWHPNDTDNVNNDPNSPLYWKPYVESITKDTWTALKSDPATADIKVIGPSLGLTYYYGSPSPLDDLSGYVDFGNFHPYPGGGNSFNYPFSYDTIDKYYWQGNFPSVNIDEYPFAFDIYAPPFGSKSMWATETGYHTSAATKGISEKMQGKYMPRIFLEYFRLGIARTFSYELIDESVDSNNPEANYGLLHNDLTPKPAYTALKNLIQVLKNQGSSFTPGSLDYTLTFNSPAGYERTQYVHHLLLQKRSGIFYLVLWHEISDGDISNTPVREISPPAIPTTLMFNQAISKASVYSLNDSGNMSKAVAAISNNTLNLNVTDKVTIVEIKPS